MAPSPRERQVQAAARRFGLKLILDRYSAAQTGRERYYLRPIGDAKYAVRVLPSGDFDLVMVARKRRHVASTLRLDDVELVLSRWNEPVGWNRWSWTRSAAPGASPRPVASSCARR